MPWTSEHIKWLVNTNKPLSTVNGKTVEVWEYCHELDDDILSAWAKHFRNHYCLDSEIDYYRRGPGLTRSEFLNNIKFPDQTIKPGPSIRAGDFGELLVADYLQYVLGYWVPRTRYADKTIRNESTKGCDIIGFKIIGEEDSPKDVLAIYEAKTQFSGRKAKPRLQDAINDSAKDQIRKAESLNAIKQRLFEKGSYGEADDVERFQNPNDKPYKEMSGAVALFDTKVFDASQIFQTASDAHPNSSHLKLVVIHGSSMMDLVHELYRRGADEA